MIIRPCSAQKILLLILLIGSFISELNAEVRSPTTLSGNYRFTYDHLTLPENEKMGLLGVNYLLDLNQYAYFGLGVYGAVYGQRGGFFTGGLDVGLRYPLWKGLGLDAGYFVGGGGGGAAPQGGGLMLRPQIELNYRNTGLQFGMGVSRVSFPNGDIASNQLSVSFRKQFKSFLLAGQEKDPPARLEAKGHRRLFSPQLLAYFPFEGTKGTGDVVHDVRMDVIGIRWKEKLVGQWWGDFATGGSWGGESDGFAQVLLGVGHEIRVVPGWSLLPGIQIGAAGGGRVDTRSGVITRASLASLLRVRGNWHLIGEGGWVSAVDGEFSALFASAAIAYEYETLRPVAGDNFTVFNKGDVQWANFRIRGGVQRYAAYLSGNGRKNRELAIRPVDQVYMKIDVFANTYVFFSGQALAAFDGGVGGYAVGLLGPGLKLPVAPGLSFTLEALIGAAGGGGIAAGGGRVAQPMASIDIELTRSLHLELGAGYIKALDGELEAWVLDAGLGFDFSVPHGNLH